MKRLPRPSNGKGVWFDGEWITLAEAVRRVGIGRRTVEDRIYRQGLPAREALTRPVMRRSRTVAQLHQLASEVIP